MDRFPFDTEDRDALVADLAERLLRDWSRQLLAGDQRAISNLHNVMLDRLTDADAAAIFIQALSDQAAADATFAAMVARVMFDRCEAEAENAVDAMARRRTESRDENRIAQAAAGRALH